MREMCVRIRFTGPSLGNVKAQDGRFLMPRGPDGSVTFLSTWHHSNLRFASRLLGRHRGLVGKTSWSVAVAGVPGDWYRRYYNQDGRRRYCLHEAFLAGQEVEMGCVVPSGIPDADFEALLALAGRYRGLSPWRPGEFGFFEVAGLRRPSTADGVVKQEGPGRLTAG
jgi:hypothetical protein